VSTSPRHRHSPRVRRLARQNGIDADVLAGTGPGGRVTPGDILRAREQAARSEAPLAVPAGSRGQRQAGEAKPSAALGAASPQTPGHTQVIEVDLTLVLAQCAGMANPPGLPVRGIAPSTPFVAKAVLESLQAHPLLRTGAVADDRVARHTRLDLGVAFDTPDGLLVPVLRDAGALSLAGLQRRLGELATRALFGEIQAPELTGSSFTLLDSAGRSIIWDAPVLGGAQSAALSVGAPVERPVVVRGEGGESMIAIRSMAYIALTYHHQLIQRAEAAEFLMAVKAKLEKGRFR
jgi:pyruvate dehydrogenase E2 component (dihydrolipoamide acetyltransferase)